MIPLRSLALLERGASPHRGSDATPRAFDRLDWYQKTYFHDDPDRLGIWLREQGFSDRETAARYIEIDASVAESNATWAKCISEAMAALEAQSSEARLAAAGKLGLSAISYPFLLWAKHACQAALDYVVAAGLVEDLASIRQNFMDYLLKRLELASLPTAGLLVNIERLQGRLVGESPESRGAYFAQQMVNPIERKTLLSSFPVVDRVQAEITVNAIA